jgi:hydroxyacylglutathione hydrolase
VGADGGEIRFGALRLTVLHTPGHTEGSVCLYDPDAGLLFSGDTLFAGGWGRVDLPGGDPDVMAASLARLSELPDAVRVYPGHGADTTVGRERAWLELVRDGGRLFA